MRGSLGRPGPPYTRPVLIYDGDCGFCTTTAMWVKGQLTTPISVVPWQEISDLGDLGLTVEDVTTAVYWVDAYGRTARGHVAAGRALLRMKPPYAWLGPLCLIPPTSWIAAALYRLVAKNRMRLPGATAACALPPPKARAAA